MYNYRIALILSNIVVPYRLYMKRFNNLFDRVIIYS